MKLGEAIATFRLASSCQSAKGSWWFVFIWLGSSMIDSRQDELEEEIDDLARRGREARAKRRQEWKVREIEVARSHGDTRPGDVILREAGQKAAVISRAFNESHRDRERAETVSQGTYCLFGSSGQEILNIEDGTVLSEARAMRHSDPALNQFSK